MKIQIMGRKIAWGVKAKHCWVMSKNNGKQKVCWHHPAMFSLITLSKLSRRFSNPRYPLKAFLLYILGKVISISYWNSSRILVFAKTKNSHSLAIGIPKYFFDMIWFRSEKASIQRPLRNIISLNKIRVMSRNWDNMLKKVTCPIRLETFVGDE